MADDLDDTLDRLRSDPARLDDLSTLVELCTSLRRPEDAVRSLWLAAHLLHRRRDGKALLQVVDWLIAVDPSETRNLASMALSCARLSVPSQLSVIVDRVATHFTQAHDQRVLLRWALGVAQSKLKGDALAADLVAPLAARGDEGDIKRLQVMGELYQQAGSPGQAAEWFGRVAERYAADGFFLKAVALFKQVLKLDPSLWRINLRLAELHARLDLHGEADAYLRIAEDVAARLGDGGGASEVRRLRAALFPPSA